MHLVKLEIVVLLAKLKKVTAVAEALGVKQPTVTFHMKSLEAEYGVQLFETRTGKVLLTEAGEALHHYAVQIHALAGEAKRVVDQFKEMGRGSIRLGASYVPGTYMLPEILQQFALEHPHITIYLDIKTAPVIHQMLLDHSIDIGITSSLEQDTPGLHSEVVLADELVLALPPTHCFLDQDTVSPHAVAEQPFILHDPQSSTRQLTMQWAHSHGLELRTKLEMNALELIKRSVALGQGITFISRLAIQKELAAGELACIAVPELNLSRFIHCRYHKERWLTAPVRSFLHLINSKWGSQSVERKTENRSS